MEILHNLCHLACKVRSGVGEKFPRTPLADNFILWSERVPIASCPPHLNSLPWKRASPARIGVGQDQAVDPLGIKPIELLREHAAPREAEKVRPLNSYGVEEFGERLRPFIYGERFRWV